MKIDWYLFKNLQVKIIMSDTEKQPEKQRILIAISSQQMEDRYRVEASRAKAQKMGASSRILRLFE